MKKAIERFLNNGERQADIYKDYKHLYTSIEMFRIDLNKEIEAKYNVMRKKFFPKWLNKNDIWTPATYDQLSDSEKDIYNARANRDFLP